MSPSLKQDTPAPEQPAAHTGTGGLWSAGFRHVRELALAQLRQGITPQKIALTVALGLVIGVFPVLGTTTLLCLLIGVLLRLNQPVIQLASWLAWPVQMPAIYFFVRAGEWLTRTPSLPFSVSAMLVAFKASPLRFLQQFGMMGLRAALAWTLIAPPLAALLYLLTLPPLRRMAAGRLWLTGTK